MKQQKYASAFLATVTLLVLPGTLLAQPASYDIYALPTLGGSGAEGKAINVHAGICGWSRTDTGAYHGFLWDSAGGSQDLGTIVGDESYAEDLNAGGQVVGGGSASGGQHAFLWEDGVMSDLGTLGGDNSYAWGINDVGSVTGGSDGPDGYRAFVWSPGMEMSALDPLPGGDYGVGRAINHAGSVAGISDDGSGNDRAFFYFAPEHALTDLGTLGGISSKAYDLNDADEVVGEAAVADGHQHAFHWDVEHGMVDLGTLPGESTSSARAINAAGQVVGSGRYQGQTLALLWEDEEVYPLLDLVLYPRDWTELEVANDINDNGEITGWGWYDGEARAFIMIPRRQAVLQGPYPGVAGEINRLEVHSAWPHGLVYFAYGLSAGSSPIPGCPTYAGIANPVLIGMAVADNYGMASIEALVPEAARGQTVLLQACDWNFCTPTNLVETEFE